FNALSMSFVVGEQYFIDSLKKALPLMSQEDRKRLEPAVRGFVGQEATHRHLHGLYNAQLVAQGFDNAFERRAAARIKANAQVNPRNHVGATAATEHFTAVFAAWLMRHPEALEGADERLKTLWLWHSAEEAEHRAIAFEVYKAIGGNHRWRLRTYRYVTFTFLSDALRQTVNNLQRDKALWKRSTGNHRWRLRTYRYVTFTFLSDVLRQTVNNLQRDKALWKRSTWASCFRHLFSRDGLIRGNLSAWRDYLRADFHPLHHDASASERWLRDHEALFVEVSRPGMLRAAS
ncbi:MAG: metal-dependent hydrolase, partial [Betaproteobacteria bacterium]|nr:metal-dependent hydrolase [Betaproteobacteria bacterium]